MNRMSTLTAVVLGSGLLAHAVPSVAQQPLGAFHLTEVRGVAQDARPFPGWGLATESLITFSTCALDAESKLPLRGRTFDVVAADGVSRRADAANSQGCFSWVETFPVNSLADAQGIEIRREVRSRDGSHGARPAHLAVYPLLHGVELRAGPVVDLDFLGLNHLRPLPAGRLVAEASSRSALLGLEADGRIVQRDLFVEEPVIVNSPKAGAAAGESLLMLRLRPEVLVKGLEGTLRRMPLEQGKFLISVDSFATVPDPTPGSGATRRLQTGHGQSKAPTTLLHGTLEAAIEFLTVARPTAGSSDLVVTVEPVDGPAGLMTLHLPVPPPTGAEFALPSTVGPRVGPKPGP